MMVLRSAAASDAAAVAYCSLSRPYVSAMVRSPVMRNAPKRSSERSSDSRNATSAESSARKVSVEGEALIMSKSGTNESVEPLETSNTWENTWRARCRLVCIILEKVEVELEPESEKGARRSSAGIVSTKRDCQITTGPPLVSTDILRHRRRYQSKGYYGGLPRQRFGQEGRCRTRVRAQIGRGEGASPQGHQHANLVTTQRQRRVGGSKLGQNERARIS
jgi:hypothetical protein